MAIVLAEVEASAADIHVPLEGSFAASSSVRHWAGFHPRHGKAHVWCCVPAPLSCYGADADLPGSLFFGSAVCCAQSQQKSLNRSPSSPSPPLLRGSQHRSAGNTGAPTRRARSFAAGLRDAITAAANHRSDSHRDDDTGRVRAQQIRPLD